MCSIPLPLHTRCAPVPCPLHSPHIFRGLAAQRDCSFRALRSSLTTALQSQTRSEEDISVRTRYSVLRSCIRVPSSWFPRSRRSPRSPSSEPLQPLQLHTQHQLVRAAGLSRSKVGGILPLFVALCKRRSDRCTPLEPHSVRRLPRLSPCLLTSYETLSATLPETRKMSSPTTLTHAPPPCLKSPASHARPGVQE